MYKPETQGISLFWVNDGVTYVWAVTTMICKIKLHMFPKGLNFIKEPLRGVFDFRVQLLKPQGYEITTS